MGRLGESYVASFFGFLYWVFNFFFHLLHFNSCVHPGFAPVELGFFVCVFLLKLLKFGTDSWLILLAHIYNDNDYIVLHFSASCHTEFILALSLFYS